MGLRASWLAAKGDDMAAVLERVGLVETGEVDFGGEAYLTCAQLPGWVVISSEDFDWAAPDRLSRVSADGEAVACQAWDVSMYSAASGYRLGERTWSVIHDPDRDRRGLQVEGSPPEPFAAIRDEGMRREADAEGEQVDHVFDIPLALTASLCGYHPEEGAVPPETVFKVVEPLRGGRAVVKQAEERQARDRLTAAVQADLYPLARALGFEPLAGHPAFHKFYPRGAANVFVRFSGTASQVIEVLWRIAEGSPQVTLRFFVRQGDTPRYGRSGIACTPHRPPTLPERFLGRKPGPEDTVEAVVAKGRDLLHAVDGYLKTGAPHPPVEPPVYWDETAER